MKATAKTLPIAFPEANIIRRCFISNIVLANLDLYFQGKNVKTRFLANGEGYQEKTSYDAVFRNGLSSYS